MYKQVIFVNMTPTEFLFQTKYSCSQCYIIYKAQRVLHKNRKMCRCIRAHEHRRHGGGMHVCILIIEKNKKIQLWQCMLANHDMA